MATIFGYLQVSIPASLVQWLSHLLLGWQVPRSTHSVSLITQLVSKKPLNPFLSHYYLTANKNEHTVLDRHYIVNGVQDSVLEPKHENISMQISINKVSILPRWCNGCHRLMYWVHSLAPAPTQRGFLMTQWVCVRPLHTFCLTNL